jgi:hypothetical protein
MSRLSAGALVETIDGPVQIVELVGKVMPIFTKLVGGILGFRMMREIRMLAEDAPLLLLTNTDGQTVRVGSDHVFIRSDGQEARAEALRPGDVLETGWTYPQGYVVPDAPEYDPLLRGKPFAPGVVIESIAPAGRGEVFGFSVNETKRYFLTFGALCRAQI